MPSAYQVYDAPEFMYRIITDKGELIVSPDHKVYAKVEGEKDKWKLLKIILGVLLIVIGAIGLIWIRRIKMEMEE